METIDYNSYRLHRWRCGPSSFLARPELGARLMNWNIRMSDGMVRDVIHWPEDAGDGDFAKVRGGNPILFPFSARTYDKGKLGFWRDPSGTVRPMPQHGFARGGDFTLVAADDDGFTAELRPDEAARESYPFDYRFTVRYVFEPVSFKVFLTLENRGDHPLPWSAGHHFYFKLPWHESLSRDDYRFQIPAKKCFRHAPDGSLQPIKPLETEASFGDPDVSDRIYTRLKGDTAVLGPKGGEEDVGIRILGESDTYSTWNAFVVWTEKPDSPFYCVEPWMGPPNSPEHKKGLHVVETGAKSTFGVEVSLL
ncbi:MAG: aldose epimerase [Verrucomicrobiota bacterium]